MTWKNALEYDSVPWLLSIDAENPGVRYFALRDLLDMAEDAPEVREAQAAVMRTGPVPAILDAQDPEGFWVRRGSGYGPKYRGTVWQIIFLSELGADGSEERVRLGCEYLLANSIATNGGFSVARRPVPSQVIPCLNGNLLHALLQLGHGGDERVKTALRWPARAVTGEGMSYLRSGTSGPCFACSANNRQPCGWGAVKVMRALLAVPEDQRDPLHQQAIQVGVEFLLSRDPAEADYPYTERVSSTWFKFGFPLTYWSDVLEIAAVLTDAGFGAHPRLDNVLALIEGKQDEQGRWLLENTVNTKTWADIEERKKPSKWVTLRALRVLKRAGEAGTVKGSRGQRDSGIR